MKSLETTEPKDIFYRIAYNWAFLAGCGLCLPWLISQAAATPKHRNVFRQRLFFSRSGPSGNSTRRPVWIHALSVGEVLSAIPLVKAVKDQYPKVPIVFSASTATGVETANRTLKALTDRIFHFPYDLIFSVRKAFSTIRPESVILVETDIWPNFLWETRRRHIPVYLVNARLSDKTFSRFHSIRFLIGPLLSIFSGIFTQSAIDARRFKALGVSPNHILTAGNLKFDQSLKGTPPPQKISEWVRCHQKAGKFIWTAGSTHEGEESILAGALRLLEKQGGKAALLVAPRDPARARTVGEIFKNAGFTAETFFSLINTPSIENAKNLTEILVIDTIGVLRGLYGVSDIAFVGGSLTPFGGHNPLEPAVHAKPVLFGPHMQSFREISAALLKTHGAMVTATAEDLAGALTRLLILDRQEAHAMGQRALRYYMANQGTAQRILSQISLQPGRRIPGSCESAA